MRFVILAMSLILSGAAPAEEYMGASGPTFETVDVLQRQQYSTGLIVPKDRSSIKTKSLNNVRVDLPAKFRWEQDKLTPIKNQGNCGSCWAFSAQATYDDVMKLHGKSATNHSEQWLVSCEKQSYGCQGGWYHSAFQLIKEQGNVLESDMPYKASNLKCPSSLPHYTKMIKWQELSTNVATVEDIKKAIYLYGPVSVAVSVAGQFSNYKSGIYNESSAGQVNHAVNLVGWDDTVQPGHWIMRNSWGPEWGENGEMRIAYGSRKIGYAATYIDIYGEVPHDGPVPPDPTPEPTPDPTPTPCPDCPDCPECKECTFFEWFKNLFG